VGGQSVLRYLYYGDFLPNTYYLKMTGFPMLWRISRGGFYLLKFIGRMWIIPFAAVIWVTLRNREPKRDLLLLLFGLQLLYSIYVGGDAWESWRGANRYISQAIPFFFIVLSLSLDKFSTFISKKQRVIVYSTLISVCFVLMNNNRGSFQLKSMFFRAPIITDGNNLMISHSDFITEYTDENASIAVAWAGTIPYFTNRNVVDILGKTDYFIAHGEMKLIDGQPELTQFWPGHMKYNYSYSIGEKKPDVIVHLWNHPEEAAPYLNDNYFWIKNEFEGEEIVRYLRKGSPNIKWNLIQRDYSRK
jgi:hypothetical protein